jgi:transcriptional regulator with XRE-family HTH domain
MNTNKKLGKIIQKRRLELGLSQEKLGQISKLHRTYISLLERGLRSPTITTTIKVAKALNLNISELLKGL